MRSTIDSVWYITSYYLITGVNTQPHYAGITYGDKHFTGGATYTLAIKIRYAVVLN